MATAREAAEEWLAARFHRDVWGLMRADQERILAIEAKSEGSNTESELDELSRLHAKCEGMELVMEGFLRQWLQEREYSTFDGPTFWEAIDAVWGDKYASIYT